MKLYSKDRVFSLRMGIKVVEQLQNFNYCAKLPCSCVLYLPFLVLLVGTITGKLWQWSLQLCSSAGVKIYRRHWNFIFCLLKLETLIGFLPSERFICVLLLMGHCAWYFILRHVLFRGFEYNRHEQAQGTLCYNRLEFKEVFFMRSIFLCHLFQSNSTGHTFWNQCVVHCH